MNPPNSLVRRVPQPLRRAIRAVWEAAARRRFARELAARVGKPEDPGRIVLDLGEPTGRLIHGGRVKTLHLAEAFEVDPVRANVLYLVSSSPPRFADLLVRHARARGVVFVWNQNGIGYPAWAGAETDAINRPMAALLHAADHVVYQSRFCKKSADRFLGPCARSWEILCNPVDLDQFRPADPPLPLDGVRLLTIGTHATADRVRVPIEATCRLRAAGMDARLTVAGPLAWPGAGAEMRRVVEGLEAGVVEFRPAFSRADAPAIYRGHHLLVHPKTMDPCPTVVIEALASGLPVIGSATGGLPELVDSSCGILLETPCTYEHHTPLSAVAVEKAVRSLLSGYSRYSAAARARAEQAFDHRSWVRRHGERFAELLRSGQTS